MAMTKLGKNHLRWCPKCNLPIMESKTCPVCGTDTYVTELTPPADSRPAFDHDIDLRRKSLPAVSFFYYLCARFQKLILMWLGLAFLSALLLGFYDVSKKAALKDNAVIPVLLLNTVFETLIFSPFILDSIFSFGWFSGGAFDTTACQSGVSMPLWRAHLLLVAKSAIVLQ